VTRSTSLEWKVVPTTDDPFKHLVEWSGNGGTIVFNSVNGVTGQDIWTLPMTGERKAVPYLRTTAGERGGRISPDGRWLAYFSNETGQDEVYAQSYPTPGHKVRVSPAGGQWPQWADGGRSLRYYNSGARVTIPMTEGEELTPGTPHQVPLNLAGITGAASLPDGNLHLVSVATDRRPPDILLILDWTALLGR
jgi:dipeptidyl aminopeptidase/acylaminoacyl peptidase